MMVWWSFICLLLTAASQTHARAPQNRHPRAVSGPIGRQCSACCGRCVPYLDRYRTWYHHVQRRAVFGQSEMDDTSSRILRSSLKPEGPNPQAQFNTKQVSPAKGKNQPTHLPKLPEPVTSEMNLPIHIQLVIDNSFGIPSMDFSATLSGLGIVTVEAENEEQLAQMYGDSKMAEVARVRTDNRLWMKLHKGWGRIKVDKFIPIKLPEVEIPDE